MFRGVIFKRDKIVWRARKWPRRCLEVATGPSSAVLVYDPRSSTRVPAPPCERPDRLPVHRFPPGTSRAVHRREAGAACDVAEVKRVHRKRILEFFPERRRGAARSRDGRAPGTFRPRAPRGGGGPSGTRSAGTDGRPTIALVRLRPSRRPRLRRRLLLPEQRRYRGRGPSGRGKARRHPGL